MVSVMRCLNLAIRRVLTASTLGRFIGSMTCRVARSMARSMLRSRGAMNRMASPLRPARPVRARRCTMDFGVVALFIVHPMTDAIHIEPASRHVGGDQDVDLTGF